MLWRKDSQKLWIILLLKKYSSDDAETDGWGDDINSQIAEFKIEFYLTIIEIPKWRRISITELKQIVESQSQEKLFNDYMNQHVDKVVQFLGSLQLDEQFDAMIELVTCVVSKESFCESVFFRKLSTSGTVLQSVFDKLLITATDSSSNVDKRPQFDGAVILLFFKRLLTSCQPFTPTLKKLHLMLQKLRASGKIESCGQDMVRLMNDIVSIG
ncbi:unnamed protein product [Ambrosiozyma monospora]|uniref:Unnamed protein product n=1 Tax=Ambrosiozyma monospora TaxID=43982 RepID=A0ACB5TR10_AMBMO|nr:unnamed protein product [Ambrosiozyma monospora]